MRYNSAHYRCHTSECQLLRAHKQGSEAPSLAVNIAAPYHHHPFRPGSRKAYKDQRTITPPQMDAGRAGSQARGHLVHCKFGQTIVSATARTLIELRNHNITRIFVAPQPSPIVPPPRPQSPILGLPLTIPYPAGRLRVRKSGKGWLRDSLAVSLRVQLGRFA